MVEEAESVDAFKEFTLDDAGGKKAPPPQKPAEEEKPEPKEAPKEPRQSSPPKKEAKDDAPSPDFGGPIAASPIARRLALEKGVPLKSIKGTGPGGRIIKSDIENYTPSTT